MTTIISVLTVISLLLIFIHVMLSIFGEDIYWLIYLAAIPQIIVLTIINVYLV